MWLYDRLLVLADSTAANAGVQSNPIQSNPIQSNPIQSNPIQSNPIQSNSIQFNPIQSNPIGYDPHRKSQWFFRFFFVICQNFTEFFECRISVVVRLKWRIFIWQLYKKNSIKGIIKMPKISLHCHTILPSLLSENPVDFTTLWSEGWLSPTPHRLQFLPQTPNNI